MSKRNITFTKPVEPNFLKKIKAQVGYKEGPTVDTKRQQLNAVFPEDLEDTHEEQPTVVVLQPGDLTAEEADEHKNRVQKEEDEKPADLSTPIVFKASNKKKPEVQLDRDTEPTEKKQKKDSDSKHKKRSKISLLSFGDDDEEDN